MPAANLTLLFDEPIGTISPLLHGHFIEHLGGCIDGGLWVGPESAIPNTAGIRDDVLGALRELGIPLLRWPGGCYADDYHWEDGVGPRRERPRRVNIWWGQDVETNSFGTHEFINLCRFLGAEPYLAGNLGSGSVREMRDWVEYCNFPGDSTLARRRALNGSPAPFRVRHWGVGNESWGCGGNQNPEEYAAAYRQYATYLRDFGTGDDCTPLYLIACGPDGNRPEWTRRFFARLLDNEPFSNWRHTRIHAFAAHYYCGAAGTATEFTTDQWYQMLADAFKMEEVVVTQRAAMDEFDPQRKIGLAIDEWGTWHPPTPGRNPMHLWQQSTLRDALVASVVLDTFHRHADKLVLANVAQLVNVLQSLILTEGDRMLLTPTYHAFRMHRAHRGGTAVRIEHDARPLAFAQGDARRDLSGLSASASVRDRRLTLTLTNPHASLPLDLRIALRGASLRPGSPVERQQLTHEDLHAHNTPENPGVVSLSTDKVEADAEWRVTLPPASITALSAALV